MNTIECNGRDILVIHSEHILNPEGKEKIKEEIVTMLPELEGRVLILDRDLDASVLRVG